ncbi:MAG: hypothetical protein AAFO95_10235 [Cyanobacteria bacterium J06600_6]
MKNKISIVEQIPACLQEKQKLPDASEVVASLLVWEKGDRRTENSPDFRNLLGTWDLRFITGTKKTRKRAGVVLGAGRYITKLVKIQISYQAEDPESNIGQVVNSVKLAGLQLSLTGPIKFLPAKGILAFDFTYLQIAIAKVNIYDGYVKNGLQREAGFYERSLKQQVFFKYFLIRENVIAARGKGGGLALWCRSSEDK